MSEATPDLTTTGKQHFEVLDGLRGSAALLVALFPLVVLAGAHSDAGLGTINLCKFSGRIS